MAYPQTPKLDFPLEKYEGFAFLPAADELNGWKFGRKTTIKKIFWGIHLGEDIIRSAGTKVKSCGRGRVVYSELHPGTKKHGNWGNIIIIVHKHPKTKKNFYSLYAHLGKRLVKKGKNVKLGQVIGIIGKGNTLGNGYWPEHLHFGIYVGPWKNKILPGYWRKDQKLTKLSYWKEPRKFVENYKT